MTTELPVADPFDVLPWNPLAGNPLATRDDVETALKALVSPLEAYRSPGGARIRLGHDAAHFDRAAADFEGYARPLWGLAAAGAGGADWIDWEPIRRGLANGTDPAHPEYWGDVQPLDQRMVELAALGYALRLVPDRLWAPLPDAAKRNVATWMTRARLLPFATNNWKFFRLLIDLGLEAVGVAHDPTPSEQFLEEIEALYLGDGWYRDGALRRVDHYIPFAFHFYGLLLAAYGRRTDRAAVWRDRARLFATRYARWFADDGAVIPFGRSMTYRFATGCFWGALAVADVEALPWGEIKGHYLRHLRWWSSRPIAHPDGVLSIGYAYPQRMMSEHYNSAGSPYWALKVFAPLALPADHPFWQAIEQAPSSEVAAVDVQPQPGMLLMRPPGDAVALSGGQQDLEFRFGAEKYAKFAYSARYGFSIEADERRFQDAAFDSMLGLSDDGRHYRVRETVIEALVCQDALYARWRPWPDVEVETWLLPSGPGHVRVHRIVTPRPLATSEGGFAVARTDGQRDRTEAEAARALVETTTDTSAIIDVGDTPRQGVAHRALPNTNLMSARTWVPQLRGVVPAGETVLACYVVASPDGDVVASALASPPSRPDIATLRETMARRDVTPGAMSGRDADDLVPRRAPAG